jgi:flagellar biosynthetic protein FlhB
MAEDLGDKTEAPSARRLFEARERGNIARSADLSAAIVLTAAAVVLSSFGAEMIGGLGSMMRVELTSGVGDLSDDLVTVGAHLRQTALRGVILAGPVVALLAVAAYASHFVQVGWLFSTKPLEPQLSRLNLLKGLGQIFSQRNLVKSVASVLKLAGIVAVTWVIVGREAAALAALPGLTAAAGFVHMFGLVFRLSLWILLFLGVLGLGDFLYQKWKHSEDLKMTKQEVKEERKTSDGDPEVKARRMRIARQIAMQRLRAVRLVEDACAEGGCEGCGLPGAADPDDRGAVRGSDRGACAAGQGAVPEREGGPGDPGGPVRGGGGGAGVRVSAGREAGGLSGDGVVESGHGDAGVDARGAASSRADRAGVVPGDGGGDHRAAAADGVGRAAGAEHHAGGAGAADDDLHQ